MILQRSALISGQKQRFRQNSCFPLERIAAKKFLDGELKKCKTLKQLNRFIKLVENESQFQKLKQTGVGQTTILKFLGGNWLAVSLLASALSNEFCGLKLPQPTDRERLAAHAGE